MDKDRQHPSLRLVLAGMALVALLLFLIVAAGLGAWLDLDLLDQRVAFCVAAPFLLMQPGMGAGIAASRMPSPASARLQSLITHTVFGCGLYVAGRAVQLIA